MRDEVTIAVGSGGKLEWQTMRRTISNARGRVVTVSAGKGHSFSKSLRSQITILAGLGVEGDAHMGETVKHRSRVAADPSQPNLRQVHLMHAELFDELRNKGFNVGPGDLGENIVTQGLDLLSLPRGALLRFGAEATVEITGAPQSVQANRRLHAWTSQGRPRPG